MNEYFWSIKILDEIKRNIKIEIFKILGIMMFKVYNIEIVKNLYQYILYQIDNDFIMYIYTIRFNKKWYIQQ